MSVLDQLLQELQARQNGGMSVGYRHTTPSGTPQGPNLMGPGSLFGVLGLERSVISTVIGNRGLASALPARGTTNVLPYFPYITGFLDPSGTEKNGVCDDAKVAGPMKTCIQTAQFGRYEFMTRELEINSVGLRINDADFDLTLENPPLLAGTGTITTPTVPGSPDFRNEVQVRFMELGKAFQDKLTRQLYQANPSNNSAGNGYREFPGLDILIGTDKIDAFTQVACPSLSSDIKNMNYARVDLNGNETVNALTYLMRTLQDTADRTNLTPVNWVAVMRPALFYELTAVWPCAYLTYRCAFTATDGSQVLNVDAGDQIAMRDAMRSNQYLIVDGKQIPVILDDAIPEDTSTNNNRVGPAAFASDIYILPLTYNGSSAGLYWEFIDFQAAAMPGVAAGNLAPGWYWTDGGRYMFHAKPPRNWCVQWQAKIEPRLILKVPHLAGRLNHLQYKPLQHTRDAFSNQAYFVDGGVSTGRYGVSTFSNWGQVR